MSLQQRELTGKLIFRFVIRRQDVQYSAINPSVVIYTYVKNYQLAIVIVRTVKGIKEIPCIRSFQTIRSASPSCHTRVHSRYARVYLDAVCSRCQWLIRSRVIDTSKCGQKIARLWFHTDGTTIFRFVQNYFANEKELETYNYIFRVYLIFLF